MRIISSRQRRVCSASSRSTVERTTAGQYRPPPQALTRRTRSRSLQNRGCALESRGVVPIASEDMSLPPKPSGEWPQRLALHSDAAVTVGKVDQALLDRTIEEQFDPLKHKVHGAAASFRVDGDGDELVE